MLVLIGNRLKIIKLIICFWDTTSMNHSAQESRKISFFTARLASFSITQDLGGCLKPHTEHTGSALPKPSTLSSKERHIDLPYKHWNMRWHNFQIFSDVSPMVCTWVEHSFQVQSCYLLFWSMSWLTTRAFRPLAAMTGSRWLPGLVTIWWWNSLFRQTEQEKILGFRWFMAWLSVVRSIIVICFSTRYTNRVCKIL